MYNFNKVILMGHITRDPEFKVLTDGSKVVNFTIATNHPKKASSGMDREEEVCFVDCKAWGDLADIINNNFSKGRPIFVEGRLKYETWTDKETNKKRSKLTVRVSGFEFVDPKTGSPSQTSSSEEYDGTDSYDALEEESVHVEV